eukprot:1161075-Pelagomonas_calceolata.AAC.16
MACSIGLLAKSFTRLQFGTAHALAALHGKRANLAQQDRPRELSTARPAQDKQDKHARESKVSARVQQGSTARKGDQTSMGSANSASKGEKQAKIYSKGLRKDQHEISKMSKQASKTNIRVQLVSTAREISKRSVE